MDLNDPHIDGEVVDSDSDDSTQENVDPTQEDVDPTQEDKDPIAQAFLQNSTAECLLNRDGDQLPFGLFCPETEGKLTWICGEDAEQKITSVYCFDKCSHQERATAYLENIAQAVNVRNQLLEAGWKLLIPPKIEFTMASGPNGASVPLNRRQRRYLAKQITRAEKELGLRSKK